jgi:hypothetical protein
MFFSRDQPDRLDERIPGFTLARQHAAPVGGKAIEASAALAGLFDPGPFDPAALLEAIEERIQGIDVEDELASRTRFDQLAQLVPVPRPRIQQ